jgi:hypothetical protein
MRSSSWLIGDQHYYEVTLAYLPAGGGVVDPRSILRMPISLAATDL